MLAEAELIEATSEALAAIGLTGTTIRLSDRRFLAALAADAGVPRGVRRLLHHPGQARQDRLGRGAGRANRVGFPPARVAAVKEKIQGLIDVPPASWRDALADSVPGLAAEVVGDLSATAAGLDRLAAERDR